jgi:CheY-like chemotaxis protein
MEQTAKKLVLLADDDESFREILKIKLETSNFETVTANNGNDALEKLKSLEKKPDLIILDVMMPEMDGIETAFKIKENEQYKDIPFIFLTSFGEDVHQEGKNIDEKFAKEIGATQFIRKGESLDKVIEVIKNILNNQSK